MFSPFKGYMSEELFKRISLVGLSKWNGLMLMPKHVQKPSLYQISIAVGQEPIYICFSYEKFSLVFCKNSITNFYITHASKCLRKHTLSSSPSNIADMDHANQTLKALYRDNSTLHTQTLNGEHV